MRIPDRWVLNSPIDEHGREVDPWQFNEGRRLDLDARLRLRVALPGRELDFSLTGLGIVVVHERVARVLERMGVRDVQLIPVEVEGCSSAYFILSVLSTIRCIDDARCEEVQHWKPEDGQPEKVGEYRVVAGMRIDPTRVGDAHLFRPWGWSVALIVSDELKRALEHEGITGTRFIEV
ncbi:hypothetical protein HPC49_41150 [Pyxidicoccus fallax]|uniref:Immunity MXAN-0049 protein domain-containing protein n=2 Tax=Pyxidicoccus fallax TaxID=394095 RepID=A0A848LJ45_9BACT|nr:DUF1629 domain-containing protein [Pyxidicoccus fallax]NMO17743.1 hypothetical protein [Pyxidicoccus fallax]NPC84610.1 hypothetical protein [Pyxidicoccus fallax]